MAWKTWPHNTVKFTDFLGFVTKPPSMILATTRLWETALTVMEQQHSLSSFLLYAWVWQSWLETLILVVGYKHRKNRKESKLILCANFTAIANFLTGKWVFINILTGKQRWEVPRYKSTAILKRGTFLVPLSVTSVLFQKSTVFGTVVTFLARLPRYSVLLCGMELKPFKRSWNYGEALSNLAHVIRSCLLDDCGWLTIRRHCTKLLYRANYKS